MTVISGWRKDAFAPRYILAGLIALVCVACIPSIASADVDMTGKIAPGPALKSGLSSPGLGAEPLVNSEHDGVYHCSDAYSTIANVAGGLAIGNCPRNEEFDVEDYGNGGEESGYFYGGYFANIGVCAWVKISEALKEKGGNLGHCSGGIGYKYGTFYSQINSESVHDGFYVNNSVACEEYANVDPWGADSATGPIRSVAPYTPGPEPGYSALLWRYVTNNGKYVMVRDARVGGGEGNWVFVERSCLPATLPGASEPLPKPTVTTGTPTGIATPNATLVGFVNPNGPSAKYYFEYTTSPTFATVTSTPTGEVGPGTGVVQENVPITNLAAGTTYYFRMVASGVGGETHGGPVSFTTQPPPTATTSPASGVQEIQATLNANVNPNGLDTHYYFQYGTNTSYGSYMPAPAGNDAGAGTASLPESATVTTLLSGTTYHYRVVASSSAGTTYGADQQFTTDYEQSSSRWVGYNPATGETSAYYRNSTGAMAWWQWQPAKGWENGVLGGSVASGTTPAVLYEPDSGETSVYYQNSNHEIAFWQWEPARGWGSGVLGGREAANTSPAVVVNWAMPETTVYYQNSGGEIAYWQWHLGKGWENGVLGGHAAAGSTPAVVYTPSTGETSIYYQNSSHQVAFWQWQPVRGWGSGVLGGSEAANTSPAVVYDQVTGETSIYYQNTSDAIVWWQWHPAKGWEAGTLGGVAAVGTTPAIVYTPSTGEASIYYQNSSHEIAFWQWAPGRGWGSGVLGGSGAANTSPAVVENQLTPETSVYYESSTGAIAWWQWHLGKGWENGTL